MPTYTVIVECEYCNREMASSQIANHERVCMGNPEIAEAVHECLWEAANGPFTPGLQQYDNARRTLENVPSAHTVMAALDCDWEQVGIWAGLRPQSERMKYTLEAMREVSAMNHDGQIGPTAREWETEAPPGALLVMSLMRAYGTWQAALEAAGLRHETRSYYMTAIRRRAKNGEVYAERYIADARKEAARADELYPRIPGTWKRKTYALWPSGQQVTSLVYELR